MKRMELEVKILDINKEKFIKKIKSLGARICFTAIVVLLLVCLTLIHFFELL